MDAIARFLEAASAPLHEHASGDLAEAEAILAAHPRLAAKSIHVAAALGDDEAVRQHLAREPALATAKGGPRGWDALTHLAFSRYLRLDDARGDAFVRAATLLLDAGAEPNTGFFAAEHRPAPELEPVLYGAAGVAHHEGLTRLLLARGADPNHGEVEYHAAEGFRDGAMRALVESGRMTPHGLATMLHRKLDWTGYDGVVWLLEHGADPNLLTRWGHRALDHSLARGNALRFQAALLDHGADPTLARADGATTAFTVAARAGRVDALDLFAARGFAPRWSDEDALAARLARGDAEAARDRVGVAALRVTDPGLVERFAGSGNARAVALLLDLGFPMGDALHVAAWRGWTEVVRLLLARGADPLARDARGETALALAERAQTAPSEWTPHESTATLDALRAARR